MEEKVLKEATVVLLVEGRGRYKKVHLGIKLKHIGAGCRNGPGGGIKEGEKPTGAAIRELEEETGAKAGKKFITTLPEYLEKVAIIDFHNKKSDGSTFTCRVHFFITRFWVGEANDTDEMKNLIPFYVSRLPFSEMMPADREFFPIILKKEKKVIGEVWYGPFQKEMLREPTFTIVKSFPED